MNKEELRKNYQNLADKFILLRERENRRILTLSFFRLFVFIAGAGFTVLGFSFGISAGSIVMFFTIVLFLVLVNLFSKHSFKRDFYNNLVVINTNEIRALIGDYSPFDQGSDFAEKWTYLYHHRSKYGRKEHIPQDSRN